MRSSENRNIFFKAKRRTYKEDKKEEAENYQETVWTVVPWRSKKQNVILKSQKGSIVDQQQMKQSNQSNPRGQLVKNVQRKSNQEFRSALKKSSFM